MSRRWLPIWSPPLSSGDGSVSIGRLWRPIEQHEFADPACESQPGRDQQPPPAVQDVVDTVAREQDVIEAEPARTAPAERDRTDRKNEVVLPPLLDDEEAVRAVHRP